MAFIVEDGSIVANANAYCEVQFYKDYWADRGVDVTAQTDSAIQAAIILATQYIDNNNTWKGFIVTDEQSLDWPRSSVYDKDGRLIDYQSIPKEVKSATAEYAYRSITNADGLQPDVTDLGAVSSTTNRIGDLEQSISYQSGTGGYFGIKSYPVADNYLKEFRTGSIGGNLGVVKRI